MAFARILVVDDEPAIRSLLQRILVKLGCEVLLASSVAEALAALDRNVDLVITDVKLGETGSGVEIARAAASRHPAPPVIAISGYAEASEGLALGKAGVTAFVAKPFTPEDILDVVEGLQAPKDFELDAVVRRVVGDWPMPDVLDAVRRSMVFEALARTGGNKAQAAQLLGISRQNLQHILSRGQV
jgi:two-component system, response regulator RegA